MARARLAEIDLPDFGMPDARCRRSRRPRYAARLERLRERTEARGYDRLVVYADREHSANLAWLTGFDPRFEEAILVRRPDRRAGDPRRQRVLGHGRRRAAADAPPPLPGPEPARPAPRPLAAARRDPRRRGDPARQPRRRRSAGRRTPIAGDHRGARLPRRRAAAPRRRRAARSRTPPTCCIDPGDGLRVINEVEQLAVFEWAACQTSRRRAPPAAPACARG